MKNFEMSASLFRNLLSYGLLSCSLLSASAQAHHIWLEQDAKQVKLYFGEFNLNLREASPGLLDKLTNPIAKLVDAKGEKPLTLTKTSQAFIVEASVERGQSVIAEEKNYPAYDKKVNDKTLRAVYLPAARYIADFNAQLPQLTLDVVPTGNPTEFKVYFRNQPLPKAEATVIAASGWTREIRSDERGIVTVALPWKSFYAIEVHFTDANAGVRGEDKYDTATYVTTLTLTNDKGLKAPPAPPAKEPNKP